MASRSCIVVHDRLHHSHRRRHEKISLQIHAVSVLAVKLILKFLFPSNARLSLKHVAEAGNLAEEVISTIRTAQAFGTQKIMSRKYDKNVDVTRVVETKGSIWQGVGLGCLFFVTYAGYALAFDFGTTLINEGLGLFPFLCREFAFDIGRQLTPERL
jgi:ATP-binding cassette subfamily B (MDR/TAP) protein 1